VKTFRFRPPDGGQIPFDYLPGQFLTLHIAPQGIPTKRSYTIASTPTWRDRIEITVKREDHGLVSRWLHDELKIGSEVEIEAPNGTFFFTGKEADSIVLIGGGVGITPMMSVARYLTETTWPGKVHPILGFRGPRDFIFRTEVAALAARARREKSLGPEPPVTLMAICWLLQCLILRASGRIFAARRR
jgi:ferredoxin-NADP reductase